MEITASFLIISKTFVLVFDCFILVYFSCKETSPVNQFWEMSYARKYTMVLLIISGTSYYFCYFVYFYFPIHILSLYLSCLNFCCQWFRIVSNISLAKFMSFAMLLCTVILSPGTFLVDGNWNKMIVVLGEPEMRGAFI